MFILSSINRHFGNWRYLTGHRIANLYENWQGIALNWSVVKQSLVRNCISSSSRVIWKEEVPYKNYLQFHRVSLFNLCKMDSPQAQKLSIHKQFIFPGLSLPFVNLCKISRGTWSCERHFGHSRCLVNVLWMYHSLMIFAMSKGKSVFKVNNETWKNDLCDRIGFRIASENYYP